MTLRPKGSECSSFPAGIFLNLITFYESYYWLFHYFAFVDGRNGHFSSITLWKSSHDSWKNQKEVLPCAAIACFLSWRASPLPSILSMLLSTRTNGDLHAERYITKVHIVFFFAFLMIVTVWNSLFYTTSTYWAWKEMDRTDESQQKIRRWADIELLTWKDNCLRPGLLSHFLANHHRLRHRGPDWSGIFQHGNFFLAHQRLAVIDPASGDQPLFNEDQAIAVTVCVEFSCCLKQYFLGFFSTVTLLSKVDASPVI